MKAKNILMSLLLVTGAIAAKAAGYPAELALVSQPVMVYNANSITVYYDVENIGDYTYRGSVYLYLSPDEGYYYAEKWVKVRAGRIKRIAIDIPASRIRKGHAFTIMPYYEVGDELYSFTTFEYFEPITFFWEGPRNERWVVITVGPCPRYYHRPGVYRYYYDGFRPPMPPAGHEPRPMDPRHHTYGFHKDNGGYPATHFGEGHGPKPNGNEAPKPNSGATVRPTPGTGSMSGSHHSGNSGSNSSDNSGSSVRPSTPSTPAPSGSGSSSGRKPSSGSNVSRPSSNGSTSGTSRPSSSGNVRRPSSGNSSGSSRPSGTSSSSSTRKSNSSVSSSSGRTSTSSTSSSTRSSASKSTTTSSSSRSGSSSGRR